MFTFYNISRSLHTLLYEKSMYGYVVGSRRNQTMIDTCVQKQARFSSNKKWGSLSNGSELSELLLFEDVSPFGSNICKAYCKAVRFVLTSLTKNVRGCVSAFHFEE